MIIIAFMLLLTASMSSAMEKEEIVVKEDTHAYEKRVCEGFFKAIYAHKYDKVNWYLEDKLININKQDRKRDRNGLQWAAETNNAQLLQLLILNKANLDDNKNKNNHTSLILASWHGHVEIVRALLQAGADPNKQNELGHTALHCAIEFKKRKVVELLCEYKANVELKDKDGITCFDLARTKYSTLSSWYQDSEGKAILEMAEAAAKKIRKDSLRIPVEPSKPKRDVKDIAKQLKRNEKNGSSVNLSSSSANRIESPTNKIENKSEK